MGADRNGERLKEQPNTRKSSTIEPDRKIEHQRSGIELFPESESKQKGLEGSLPMCAAASPALAKEAPTVSSNRSAPTSNPISDAEQHDLESIVCSLRDELIVNQVLATARRARAPQP